MASLLGWDGDASAVTCIRCLAVRLAFLSQLALSLSFSITFSEKRPLPSPSWRILWRRFCLTSLGGKCILCDVQQTGSLGLKVLGDVKGVLQSW